MMVRMALHGQNPQAACDAPRWQVDVLQNTDLEPGFGPNTVATLRALAHALLPAGSAFGFGVAQLLLRLPNCFYCGASNPHRAVLMAGD